MRRCTCARRRIREFTRAPEPERPARAAHCGSAPSRRRSDGPTRCRGCCASARSTVSGPRSSRRRSRSWRRCRQAPASGFYQIFSCTIGRNSFRYCRTTFNASCRSGRSSGPNRCALQWCAPRSRPSRSRSPVGRPLSVTDRTSGYLAHPRRNDGSIKGIRPSFPCDKPTAAGSRGDRSDLVAERDAGGAHARVVQGNERGTGILEVQQ